VPDPPAPSRNHLKELLASYQFWLIVALLSILGFLQYTPEIRPLPITLFSPPSAPSHLTRHAVERVLLAAPIAFAALTFGMMGGLITLLVAVLIMLPRVLFMSPYPTDACFEMAAVVLIGGLLTWLGEMENREKRLRKKVIAELKTINTISALVCRSLDLEQVLGTGLDGVLEVIDLQAKAGIFLLDGKAQELHLVAHRGLSEEFVQQERIVPVGECLCGLVAQSGEILFTEESGEDVRHSRMRETGSHAHIVVPLKSRDRVVGVMFLYPRDAYQPRNWSLELLAFIGRQIGVSVENAQLYERERQALELCQISKEHSRHYVRNIIRAQEDERKRMARELHDDTAQVLLLLSRRIDTLASSPGRLPEHVAQGLEELRDLTGDILQGVRRFSRGLRPPTLDDLGLLPALEAMTAGLLEADGVETELEVIGERRRLSPETELVLFRIAQEALRNVQRHAQATKAVVRVEFGDNRIRITVCDNGKGFEQPEMLATLAQKGKMGLVGMRERAQLVGGTLTVHSGPGQGTVVAVDVSEEGH